MSDRFTQRLIDWALYACIFACAWPWIYDRVEAWMLWHGWLP